MKYLLLILSVLVVSCTSKTTTDPNPVQTVGCSIEGDLTTAFANSVSQLLTCTDVTAIQVDLLNALGKANLCAKSTPAVTSKTVSPKGVIGDIVCPLAVQSVMGLVGTKVPVGWKCTPAAGTSGLNAALVATCSKVVGI